MPLKLRQNSCNVVSIVISRCRPYSALSPALRAVQYAALLVALFLLSSDPFQEIQSAPLPAEAFFIAFQDTTPPPGRGGFSRRAQAIQRRIGARDTTTARMDSLFLKTLAAQRDSSARLAQFHHVRNDPVAVDLRRSEPHPLFLRPPPLVRHEETLDSGRFEYRIRRIIGSTDTKIPLSLSLEEYRSVRLERAIRQNWQALAQQYELAGDEKQDLGDVFGQITNIQIPVPKNPLFSIFGKNVINIQINGAVDIHGAFRNTKSDLQTQNFLDQSRSEPDFDQQVRVGVRGEIGDKLKINADWDTERTFEYENQLKVHYTGYEDEIIQSVEAGNVSLQTNSSFISSSQALFGVKAGFQFGPLKLTTIASQKRGQVKELSVSSGQRATPFSKKPYEYSRDHFFLDTLYRSLYEQAFTERPLVVNPDFQILDIEVWVSSLESIQNPTDQDGIAFISTDSVLYYQNNPGALAGEISAEQGTVEIARFKKLIRNVDYTLHPNFGYITLNRSLQQAQVVAAAYSLPQRDIGIFEAKDTLDLPLVLKLVRPKNLHPGMKPAWDMMLKNIYSLGGRDIAEKDFKLNVEYEISGQQAVSAIDVLGNEVNLLAMFGLDLYSAGGEKKEDGAFDFDPGITIDQKRGELIFPSLEPFAENIRKYVLEELKPPSAPDQEYLAVADSFAVDEVYDTTYNGAQNARVNRFTITGSIVSGVQSKYNLGFNVAEGSVTVDVDGRPATPNVDYTVDYLTGTVVIQNQAFLTPGANIQIKYEANDLFALASKSLVGARGEVNMGKSSLLGFTIMNLNQQTLSDKVRLGEEPISNTIMGIDGGTSFNMDFITRALNWLPGIRTNAPSGITIKGEAAYMVPDPNTRKSTIAQDEDQGVAYIDDFEGARRTIPLGVNDAIWRDASPPAYISTIDPYQPPFSGEINLSDPAVRQNLIVDSLKMEFKAKLAWFNIFPSDVIVTDIWPARQTRTAADDFVTTLNFFLLPSERGAFNYSLNLTDSLFAQPTKGWAGVMRPLSTGTINLLDENITFVELWIRVEESTPDAKLNIDLGTISEDVIPNRLLNTEDGLGGGIKRGTIEASQDLGLDMLTDEQERTQFAAFLSRYPQYTNDPSGDNYGQESVASLDPRDYLAEQGTQGNFNVEGRNFADTEDWNGNNIVDRIDSYFEYEISLDTTSADFLKYVSGGEPNTGWYQLRIPIKEFTRRIGNPTLTNIEAIRLWMTGASNTVYARITEFNLVGNQWEALNKDDDNFRISSVNIEENPFYSSPPGVKRPLDRTRPDQVIEGNEQSLSLLITNMQDGESKRALKKLVSRPLDVFSYRTMKFFVHGDDRPGSVMQYSDTSNYDVEFFFRFGTDSLNYYEYRAPLRPGWHPDNWVTIRFEDLTGIKLVRDSANVLSPPIPVPGGAAGAVYRVLGNPALTKITELVIGVENPVGKGTTSVTGEVWVNELRLSDVDDSPGWAYRMDGSVKLADVATVSFGLSQRDPFFHGLEQRFGSRNNDRNWSISSTITLEKFLPESWKGSRASLTYSHTEAMQVPRYVPGTDILVDEAAERTAELAQSQGATTLEAERISQATRERSRSLTVTETYALPTLQLSVPSSFWLVTETINRMSFAYSFSQTRRRDPVTESYYQWGWNFRFNYGLQFGPQNFFQPFRPLEDFFLFSPWKAVKLFYLPKNLSFGTSFARAQTREQSRSQTQPKPVGRNFQSTRQMSFSWQLVEGGLINPSLDYTLNVASSLVHLEVDEFGRQRSLSEILGDMLGGGDLFNFGLDRSYSQNISINTRLVMPTALKLDKIFTPSFRYTTAYDWQNNFQAGALGKSAGRNVNATSSLDVNLKSIADEIWSPQKKPATPGDTTQTGPTAGERIDQLTRILFKMPFFDWERLSVSFTHTNTARHGGVIGDPGFMNVFGRVPFAQGSLEGNGPSLLYQLGLSSDPHGDVVVGTKGSFPFIGGSTIPGRRAPLGNLSDVYGQNNNISMRTSRALWDGARLDLNWTLAWSYNTTRTIKTDAFGVPTELNRTVSGDISRSFVTFPNSFVFSIFKTGMEEVNKRYELLKGTASDPRSDAVKLIEAFEGGMEALPIGKNLISALMPRPNWSFRWDGLEKLPLFSSFASRVTLDHAYTSTFRKRWRLTSTGEEVTESENVTYGFSPLAGVTVTFKEVGKGNMTGNVRYSTTTSYDLAPAVQTVTESNTADITLTANYSQRGFEFPFFGLSLSNDLDITFSYSYSKNNRRAFDFKSTFKEDGQPLEGTIRTIVEPRIRYTLSSRVSASIYYKYTRLKPDEGGSLIPGSTINEGGLDIRVQIS